jgi:hypothetical protein
MSAVKARVSVSAVVKARVSVPAVKARVLVPAVVKARV